MSLQYGERWRQLQGDSLQGGGHYRPASAPPPIGGGAGGPQPAGKHVLAPTTISPPPYRGRAATKMTCGFSVSPGKLSFACVPLALSPGCIARFSGPSRHPPATRPPLCPGPTCPHPFLPAQWGCCPAPPQPHEHHALLPRQVRCPRPRCPQRLRPSLLLRLVASFVPTVADCSTTSGNTASPTKTSRLTAWRLPLAWRRPPSDWPGNTVARSASTPPNTARKTSLGRSPPATRIKEGPDLRAAQCRSPYVVPDPQEPPDAQTRDPVPPTQVPAPVSLPDPSDLRLHAHPHPEPGSPSAFTCASTAASGWPGR